MYIAICDDHPLELKKITGIVADYAAGSRLPVRYRAFSHAEAMLAAAREEPFTHYFLDIMMPGLDGMAAAEEIRTFDTEARLIFLTGSRDYAYQSYRVRAYDYLLKPVQREKVFSLLRQLEALEESTQDCLSIHSGRGLFRIPFARLSYLEINQKQLYFCMADGEVLRVTGSLADFEAQLLAHPGFVKIHRSYIVNLMHVSVLSGKGCRMFGGADLPVSRLLYHDVQTVYMGYLFAHRGGGVDDDDAAGTL